MIIKIHRGTREIGGSCVEIAQGKDRIVIDMGLPLIGDDGCGKAGHSKGIGALPGIEGLYSSDKSKKRVSGLFVSHAHLDHYGLIHHADRRVPVFLGRATRELIEISCAMSGGRVAPEAREPLDDRIPLEAGCFRVTPFLVDHSAMDAYAFLVEAGGKKVFYSGDFRAHGRKGRLMKGIIEDDIQDIDALILEGTNIASPKKAKSETDIEEELARFFKRKKDGIVLVSASSQNLDRLVSIYKAARKAGKTFVIDPYTAFVLNAMAKYGRFPDFSGAFAGLKVFFPNFITGKLVDLGCWPKIVQFSKFKITKEELTERRSGIVMMVKSSMKPNLRGLKALEGGSLVWSMWEGYLKEKNGEDFLGFLSEQGVSPQPVVIHTSGHADLDTLKDFAKALDPRMIIPIHTMNPEKYGDIFPQVKHLKDGEEFEI